MKKKDYKFDVRDLGISKVPTPDAVFDSFQKEGRYTKTEPTEDYDGNEDGTLSVAAEKAVEYAIPAHDSIEHGPVKVYTPEEIAQYEKDREDD